MIILADEYLLFCLLSPDYLYDFVDTSMICNKIPNGDCRLFSVAVSDCDIFMVTKL